MSTDEFYSTLPPLRRFSELANPAYYVDAPANWYVLIADLVGSTEAIASGRYKDVNLLGAASIIAVLNAVGPIEIPFVFGGDGASLLVPPFCFQQARDALLGVRHLANVSFGMDLRVGAVPVATVRTCASLKVAKFQLTSQCCQASFIGGGMTYATDLIKLNPLYQLECSPNSRVVDLTGLECRWQDVPSRHGEIVSLIVAAMPSYGLGSGSIYKNVLAEISRIYGEDQNYNPLTKQALKLTFNPIRLMAELKARSPTNRWIEQTKYLAEMLFANLLGVIFMNFKLDVGGVDWGHYKDVMCLASDYQKIDDILRMVISGTSSQTQQLTRYLEARLREGQLVYGLHISNRALITCLILDRRDHHFHLIDGADGGYTLAAKALKARLNNKSQNWKSYLKLVRRRQHQDPYNPVSHPKTFG